MSVQSSLAKTSEPGQRDVRFGDGGWALPRWGTSPLLDRMGSAKTRVEERYMIAPTGLSSVPGARNLTSLVLCFRKRSSS